MTGYSYDSVCVMSSQIHKINFSTHNNKRAEKVYLTLTCNCNVFFVLLVMKTLVFYSQNGGTPLLYAVRGNHIKCVEALLGISHVRES